LVQSGGAFLLHSVHEAGVPGSVGVDWQSPYGYGGPLSEGAQGSALEAAWAVCDSVARERKVIAEFIRFHPLADNHRLYPGAVRDDRPVVAIDLGIADLVASYTVRGRNTLRKAQRAGVVAQWEDGREFGSEFAAFYHAGMRRIGAHEFYLFSDTSIAALLALPYARLLSLRHNAQLIAAGLFLFGPKVAEYHLSATALEGRALGATNLMLHEAARRAQAEGCSALHLGGGTNAHPDNALLRFKESFAPARHRFRIGYRVIDRLAYDGLRDRFPEQAARSGRVLFYRST